jgi:hypothetical protein
MSPPLAGQIDKFSSFARAADRGLDHRCGITGNRHYRAVVGCIHRPVEKTHTLYAHRSHYGLDPPGIRAL